VLVSIINERTGELIARRVTCCDTFWKKGWGLMFRRSLGPDEAYLFVESRESIALTTIHMLFVFFPIAVIWLDNSQQVVDTVLARPFRPYYAPSQPARYFVECVPAALGKVRAGDRLAISVRVKSSNDVTGGE
jgi:uncharacterized membrane protein (UPF0127 family)